MQKKYHSLSQIRSFFADAKNLRWVNNMVTKEYEGFIYEVVRTKVSSAEAKRVRYSYSAYISFLWPQTNQIMKTGLPHSSRDSYAGVVTKNKALINSRLRQHFQNRSDVTVAEASREFAC